MSLRARVERWLAARWYGERPIAWLTPLTLVYASLLGLRALLRALGWQRPERLPVPVVVVGNLTVGGTGKTPFVLWLARALAGTGRHPGIVTRGYGGRATARPLAVSPATPATEAGDEAVLLARRAGCPVYAAKDRLAAARALLAVHPEVDVIVADDGLEHRRLARDVEIVMLDGARGFGNGWWLPAGPLREPRRRLARADLLVATGQTAAVAVDAPVMRLVAEQVTLLDGTAARPLAAFAGRRVHAVAGIGHPERFFALLEAAGLEIERHAFADHEPLAPAALAFDDDAPVLMTEKDAVRLPPGAEPRLWQVPVKASFLPHDETWILDTVARGLARA